MPPRSIKNQEFWLQKQVSQGAALETAMLRPGAWKLKPAYNTTQEPWRGQGSRVVNGVIKNSELAGFDVDGMQDFNSLHFVLDSLLGAATLTTPGGATNARQRVWNLATIGVLTPVLYTGIWGDATQAVKMIDCVFNSLEIPFSRTDDAKMSSSMIAQKPLTGATKPTQGATHKYVSPQPIAGRNYGIWLDGTWAALGTTKALAVYGGSLSIGATWTPDWPVNDSLPSHGGYVENEDVSYEASLKFGFDAAAVTHLGDWDNGETRFIRIKATGPIIEEAIPYSLQIDMAVKIVNPDAFDAAQGGPTLVLPFTYAMTEDPVSGNAMQITLVNKVP